MAARRRRKSTTRRRRRRNPVGALIINPRRKRRTTRRRRTTTRRRRNTSKASRRRAALKGWRKRRRNTVSSRSRNPRRRRRTRTYRRRRNALLVKRKSNPRRRRRRRVRTVYRRRRNQVRRRRNTGMASLKSALNKIPVVGGFLSHVVGFVPHAAFGALGVEPTIMAAKYLGPYVPYLNSSLFYALTGTLLAGLISKFAPVAPATRAKLAVAVASAAGGVAYYKWRTGTDVDTAEETAGLLGDSQYVVEPYGDVFYSDVFYGRRPRRPRGHRIYRHPRQGGRQGGGGGGDEGPPPPPPPGHPDEPRWLAKLLGPKGFNRLMKLAPPIRRQKIEAIKHEAMAVMDMAGMIPAY